jgi:hypothetical protein
MLDGTTYGLLGVLVLLHLATLAYAYRRRAEGGGTARAADGERSVPEGPTPGEFDADTVTVSCGVCGTENAAEFSFCRVCVSELPTYAPASSASGGMSRSGSA